MSADRPSCSPVRVRRGADAGTVLDVGTVTDGGRAVLAVLVLVDGAGPGCREWWPAAACEVGPAPRSGWVAFLGADPAELAALGGYVRRYPLPATVAERADPLADRPVLPPVALRAVTRIAAGLGVLVLTADGPGLEALAELADKLTGGGR